MKYSWIALVLAALVLVPFRTTAQTVAQATPAPSFTLPPYNSVAPVRVLGLIRRVYRAAHRPPPPYEIYTMVRTQVSNYGNPPYPDYSGSYTTKYWVRNEDRAALTRRIFRDDAEGDMVFQRPELNEATDPGPPTVDLFAAAPVKQHPNPQAYVPTPEPSNEPLKSIASVVSVGEPDYNVSSLTVEGSMMHLVLKPRRDPERNVLREIWADKKSYELRKIIAHDRLFTDDQGVFPIEFVYTLGYLHGQLVITHLHGVVEPRVEPNGTQTVYGGDGRTVEFDFQDISFPSTLPSWYFNPREYAQNKNGAPE
ncbi:MAG TPA: hypothetical protein VFL13_06395 [Candidatus Baltobacteraceae bacterium]|nr:hypothetical protein [Candidatus Baltobacteraceae bacterium]